MQTPVYQFTNRLLEHFTLAAEHCVLETYSALLTIFLWHVSSAGLKNHINLLLYAFISFPVKIYLPLLGLTSGEVSREQITTP